LHQLRKHADFIPELSYVAELDGKIIGHIAYSKSKIIHDNQPICNSDHEAKSIIETEVVTIGPISVHTDFQKKGIGKPKYNRRARNEITKARY
jgi:predicted N-acetyltransferase YhbS